MVQREQVIEALKQVYDPELFLDVWFMGLIYEIAIDSDRVAIKMTLTSPLCPAGPSLVEEIKEKVLNLEGVSSVDVSIVFDPPWEPSDEVKGLVGML